jgi:hypothetical protein
LSIATEGLRWTVSAHRERDQDSGDRRFGHGALPGLRAGATSGKKWVLTRLRDVPCGGGSVLVQ